MLSLEPKFDGLSLEVVYRGGVLLRASTRGDGEHGEGATENITDHPRVHVLGHPTGRLIGKREPYAVDLEQMVKAARDYGVLLEVNA
jgi:histidinol phosphatase-like PHP family hydrolase